MKCALAPLLLVACDAQVDNRYAGEPLAALHATAVGFRAGDIADGAAVRWNPQQGSDLRVGPMTALPLEPVPPSALIVPVASEPPDGAYFDFARPPRIAEGLLFLTAGTSVVATSVDTVLIHVDGEVEPGSLAADYLGGTPSPGFHLGYIRPTTQLTAAQAYLAMQCGGGDACRTPRLYRLLIPSADLATEVEFFRSTQ